MWPIGKCKIAKILEMTSCTCIAKQSEIWDSGVLSNIYTGYPWPF